MEKTSTQLNLLGSLESKLKREGYRTEIVTVTKNCLRVAVKNTFGPKFKGIPKLHYEFIFNDKSTLKLDLEIHCEDNSKKFIFLNNRAILNPDSDEYSWAIEKNKYKIRSNKNIVFRDDSLNGIDEAIKLFLKMESKFSKNLALFYL